ncbi:hypothetical protein EsH8_VI_000457 [Colletotrichum jinshuiense]
MALKTELTLRPAPEVADGYETDTESEWIMTPTEETLVDDDEVHIDPNGDLLLHVGSDPSSGDTKSFRVCSSTLRRASPFWNRTLMETSSETRPLESEWWGWTPSLFACQYEKSDGLLILLNMIHSQFQLVPRSPTLSEIYNTLSLASLYEMEHVLQPWIARWYDVLEGAEASRSGHDIAMLVCIAWALGDERLFAKTMIKIAVSCVVDGEGHITTADGIGLDEYTYDSLGSPVILENIRSLRSRLSLDLTSHINDVINRLIDGKWLCAGISGIPVTRNKKCDYVVLGSIFAGLVYVRGSRTTEVEIRADESIMDLLKSLKRVLSYMTCYENHPVCNPAERIADAMKKSIDVRDLPLGTDCVQKMREQRQKTGIDDLKPEGEN